MPVRDVPGTVGHRDGTRPFVAVRLDRGSCQLTRDALQENQRGRTRDGWPDSNRSGMRVSV